MKKITQSLILALLGLVVCLPAWGQSALNSTTLSAALNAVSQTVSLTSASNINVGDVAFVDREAMRVLSVNTTTNRIEVQRGMEGTVAVRHASGQTVYVDRPDRFINKDLAGACTAGAEYPNYTPLINLSNGNKFRCTNSQWDLEQVVTQVKASFGNNMALDTVSDNRQVRINSRNFTQTSGSSIGFQSKPAQTVTSTGSVIGGEISPRVNDDIDIANVIGLHVDSFLKGTTAKTISGDVRALQLELVTDDAATNTISGNVNAIRIRSAFSATTITGSFIPIRIEKAEAQTNSQQYTHILDLTGTETGVWNTSGAPTTNNGYIKVRVNGLDRWIQLLSTSP